MVPNADLTTLGVNDLRRLFGDGDLRPEELMTALLQRIESMDRSGPAIRSIIQVNPDAAEEARTCERDEGRPLHGIPILVKDNIDTQDAMLTTAGSVALQ